MLEWHDCKTDPPKKSGRYILVFFAQYNKYWQEAYYNKDTNEWELDPVIDVRYYKWAEIELPE